MSRAQTEDELESMGEVCVEMKGRVRRSVGGLDVAELEAVLRR